MRLPLILAGLALLAGCSTDASSHQDGARQAAPQKQTVDTVAYFPFQVDTAADMVPGQAVPKYPKQLRDAGIEGEVTLRFVVDTTGHADTSRIVVLTSSHRYFTEAVRAALPKMRFLPAVKGGRRVRQIIEQPFRFSLQRY